MHITALSRALTNVPPTSAGRGGAQGHKPQDRLGPSLCLAPAAVLALECLVTSCHSQLPQLGRLAIPSSPAPACARVQVTAKAAAAERSRAVAAACQWKVASQAQRLQLIIENVHFSAMSLLLALQRLICISIRFWCAIAFETEQVQLLTGSWLVGWQNSSLV
jgi:hypothetical protein